MSDLSESSEELRRIYHERFSGKLLYRRHIWKELVERVFSAWVPPESTVLDLGCGYCEFINEIRARKKYGIDLNPDAIRNAAPDVKVIRHNCSDPWPIPEASVDVVFTSNFFEHLPTKKDLSETLNQVLLALKPSGRLIAIGPNIRYVQGAYWDFYDHHIPLTDRSMAEEMRSRGFLIEYVKARFLPYTMSDQTRYPFWVLRAYLRLPLTWSLFGKQFLIVARKP